MIQPQSSPFAPPSDQAVVDLVRAQPLAWIVSAGAAFAATPLPVRPKLAPDGGIAALIGHFARRNPQVDALRRDPRALILVMGPHGYVSPSWLTDRTQAPTWNFASARFEVEVEFLEDEAALRAVIDDLVASREAGRPNPWSVAEMGARYDRLAQGIVAFHARVLDQAAVFKLGQDERDDVYPEILAGLEADSATLLAAAMRTANPGRAE